MGLFTPKKKTIDVIFIEENVIQIGKDKYHRHDHELQEIRNALSLLIKQNKKIMATQKEAADKVNAVAAELAKANTEIQAKIQALVDAAGNADNVSTELQTAIDNLVPAAQALDDIVPDAPTT